MICPHCNEETNKYLKDGAGTCEHCNRLIQYEVTFKPEIKLPGIGKLISEFAAEVANELKDTNELFYRVDSKEIIEIGKIKPIEEAEETYTGFLSIRPNRFITLIEKHITPGKELENRRTQQYEFKPVSINAELSGTLLASDQLQKALPQLNRLFTIPIPILYKGEITFPCKGYDARFGSWLPEDAPEIKPMELTEAKEVFKDIFQEFCFQTQQDYYNALAGLLTPFLRGLFTSFNVRTPVFFYLANRERAGKDYLAGITGIVYEGCNLEDAPICNAEHNRGNNSEELRKKILSAMLSGRKRMHFSNNKGYIDNAVFEQITTSEKYTDRVLGRSETLTFDNEIDFSLSGNVGVGFTPDFANRCRFVRLFLEIENANERQFTKPNLHNYVLQNRSKVISAMYSLVKNWKELGMKEGAVNFASYSQWAKICGGIMEAAGYGNPCTVERDIITVAGDSETTDMKTLFETMYEMFPDGIVEKKAIVNTILNVDLFGYWDLENNRGDQTKFGNLLTKYVGRYLSDITLIDLDPSQRPARKKYQFTKQKKEVKIFDF
jgi:hypothetical protein